MGINPTQKKHPEKHTCEDADLNMMNGSATISTKNTLPIFHSIKIAAYQNHGRRLFLLCPFLKINQESDKDLNTVSDTEQHISYCDLVLGFV